MEEKKNNQVQALDDDALENVAGGWSVYVDRSKFAYQWICRDCWKDGLSKFTPEKCEKCGSSNLVIRKIRK